MKLIRNGLFLLAAISVAAGPAGASTSRRATAFYSPVEIKDLRKIPNIKVIHTIDYTKIVYPRLKISNKTIDILEYRTEDESWFDIFENKKYLYHNIESSGYWGYRLWPDLKIYFVDEPLEPGHEYYRDYDYTYERVVVSEKSVVSEDCHYKFQSSDGKVIQALLSRKIELSKPNPLPLAISAVLAKGTIRQSDTCAPRAKAEEPNAKAEAQAH